MKSDSAPTALIEAGWLSRSAPEFREAFLAGSTARRVPSGAYLYHTDDAPGGLWGLESGSMAIEFPQPDRLLKTAYVLHRGHWLGEAPLLDGRQRGVGVRALTDCMFHGVPIHHVRRLLSDKPEYWQEIARLAFEHYEIAAGIAADAMIPSGRQRLLAVLMRLSGLRDCTPPDSPEVILSKEELGAITNLSRSSLTPILRHLETRGVIEIGYRSLRVVHPVMLGEMVGLDNDEQSGRGRPTRVYVIDRD